MSSDKSSGWKKHAVRQLNPGGAETALPAQHQIVTESWNRVVAVPYIVYMPEKDRLLMLVSCDYDDPVYIHDAMVLSSDDGGATWSEPRYVHTGDGGKSDTGMGYALTYLGKGRALLYTWHPHARWFSHDYGKTWGDTVPLESPPDGRDWYPWDPPLVDRDPATGAIVRLMETGYTGTSEKMVSQAYVRCSTDGGRSWGDALKVPEWRGVDEVFPLRAANGHIVATCRTDPPKEYKEFDFDHYEGLGVSISRDDGRTWSAVKQLYDWGRHHASMVLMPDGAIVMTYVVRLGYPDTADGFPQFGVEAVVSRDNGETWDLDRRYILASWQGNKKNPASPAEKSKAGAWCAGSQGTSTLLLPDGSLLTAYGTGYRAQEKGWEPRYGPRDIGLVRWRIDAG